MVIRKEKGHPKERDLLNGIKDFWSYGKNWLFLFLGVPENTFTFS